MPLAYCTNWIPKFNYVSIVYSKQHLIYMPVMAWSMIQSFPQNHHNYEDWKWNDAFHARCVAVNTVMHAYKFLRGNKLLRGDEDSTKSPLPTSFSATVWMKCIAFHVMYFPLPDQQAYAKKLHVCSSRLPATLTNLRVRDCRVDDQIVLWANKGTLVWLVGRPLDDVIFSRPRILHVRAASVSASPWRIIQKLSVFLPWSRWS